MLVVLSLIGTRPEVVKMAPVIKELQKRPDRICSVVCVAGQHRVCGLTDPLDHLSMVHLMKRSTLILTDSGGIQEEAPSLGVPVLVMRETTERPEAVEAGVARLVGTDRRRIVEETTRLLQDPAEYATMTGKKNPFGDGKAAARIVSCLLEAAKEDPE